MRPATLKKQPASPAEFQEAFDALYAELQEEFTRVQSKARKFQQARPSTEAYDQAWADLYVSLSVLETKARSLQEILDQINEQQDDEEA